MLRELTPDAAFIVTGGLGAIGKACVLLLLEKGAIPVVFDQLDEAAAKAVLKEAGAEAALYVKTDITDVKATEQACGVALQRIPKGSLAGGIHCAGIAPGRKWSHKLVDSAAVSDPS
jgi:3-hydroxyacyl-CoA dehydrogenase